MYYPRFWKWWFSNTNHDVVQSFDDCVRIVRVGLQLGRKSFASNWVPQPHFSTSLKFISRCLDVVSRLHPFCRHAESFPSKIVKVFKTCQEISNLLLWRRKHFRWTTEQKILGKTNFTTKQHLWLSIAGILMDNIAVYATAKQRKLQSQSC